MQHRELAASHGLGGGECECDTVPGGVCVCTGGGKVCGPECDRVCVQRVHECDMYVHAMLCACDTCVTWCACARWPCTLVLPCVTYWGECERGWVCHRGVVGACDTAHVCA